VLSGPNLAREIAEHALTATVVASEDEALCQQVQAVLHGRTFRVYASSDRFGVELGGALKNVYAIIAGMAVALGMGENTKSMLITRALAEMTRFAVSQGANPMTFLGLAGVGDLIVTCSSPKSRNYQVGYALGQGLSLEEAVAWAKWPKGSTRSRCSRPRPRKCRCTCRWSPACMRFCSKAHAEPGDRAPDACRAQNRRRFHFHQRFQLSEGAHERSERAQRESIILRVLWMLVFLVVWQLAELLLGGLVLVQLIYRLIYGAPSASLMNFGDSLSQYLAQIGRFGSFHSDQKPWPFADWPPRAGRRGATPWPRPRIRCVTRSPSCEAVGAAPR
jgi:hypothetical protein